MTNQFFTWITFFILAVSNFVPWQAHGGGFIVIESAPQIMMPQKPLRFISLSHHVSTTIDNQMAVTRVEQVFENPYSHNLEGSFIFPIPKDAAIHDFKLYVNNEPIAGQIFDKDAARKIYETIVISQKDPALLEYADRGMFQGRLRPISPISQLRIVFEYSELLKADNGTVKYTHTFSTNKLLGGKSNNTSISVDIHSNQQISNIYSPTHQTDVVLKSPTDALVRYQETNTILPHDFILYYTLPKDEIGFNVVTFKENLNEGFFLAMLSPNNGKLQDGVIAKNILFVLDTSGSMYGNKIEQAKKALKFCLNNLNKQDRFNIISFNASIDFFDKKLVNAANQNINKALAYVDGLEANGGTDIDLALKNALKQLSADDNSNMIIFLTDGEPTVGECDIRHIIRNVKQSNLANTRLFSFGVGFDVNTTLLDKVALDNKGASDYVRPDESIESTVTQFYKKVAHPVLTDLRLTFSGTKAKEILPVDLPDMFFGSQLVIVGRYTDGGNVSLHLSGNSNAIEKHYVFNTHFAVNQIDNDFLPRIWASRKIAFLVDQIVLEGNNDALVKDLIALSKKYGIITKYTTFLVHDDSNKAENAHAYQQMACASLAQDANEQVGACSVARAKNQQHLRNNSTMDNAYIDENGTNTQERIRNAGPRTFYQHNDVWVDAEHSDDSPITHVKMLSPEYFDLLEKFPEYSPYFALGNKVMFTTEHGSICVD